MPWDVRVFPDEVCEINVYTEDRKNLLFAGLEFPVQFVDLDPMGDDGMKIRGSNGASIKIIPDEIPTQVIVDSNGSYAWIDVDANTVDEIARYIRRGRVVEYNPYNGNVLENNRNNTQPLAQPLAQPLESRNIPANATNAITYNSIQNGNEMVTFHGNLNRNEGRRYYKRTTYNSLNVNPRSGLKQNPFTRQNIRPENTVRYTARVRGGGKKTRRTRRHQ
jgi:hypothetical protein